MTANCFPGSNVEGTPEYLAVCACGNVARHGQWDCHACHATAQRVYRARHPKISTRSRVRASKLTAMIQRIEETRV